MKILIINKFLHPSGGSETYVFSVGAALETLGHTVQYFGMDHPERIVKNAANSYTANMDFQATKMKNWTYPFRIIYSFEARKKLRAVLKDFHPDIVHLNNFNFQLTPSILHEIRAFEQRQKQKIRIIYTAHDAQLVCPNHLMRQYISGKRCMRCLDGSVYNCARHKCIHGSRIKSLLGSVEGCIYRTFKTYRLMDAIICPSRFMKDCLDKSPVLREKTIVMPSFVPAAPEPQISQCEYPYVLYFGRYSPEKGISTLLTVAKRLPQIPFVFAGTGPLEEAVNAVENIKNMAFLSGDALTTVIKDAAFALFPSECYENSPFAVMEALSLGTPVIAADIGGVPELIADGANGELFTCGDADELCEKIHRLWNDPAGLAAYRGACVNARFMTAAEYGRKLVEDIYVR